MSVLDSAGGDAKGLLGQQMSPEDLGYDAAIIAVPRDDYFDTKALALVEQNWLDKINAIDGVRWRMLPLFNDISSDKEEDLYNTSSIGVKSFLDEGKTTMTYKVKVTPFVKKQLRTMNGIAWDIFIFTSNGFCKFTSSDGIKVEPFSTDVFRVGAEEPATRDVPTLVPITVTYADTDQLNDNPGFIEPLREGTPDVWNLKVLKDPKAVKFITVGTPTATTYDMDVVGYDGVPKVDVLASDVLIVDSSGVEQTISSCTPDPLINGRYACVVVVMAADTYQAGLKAVGLTATQGYNTLESDLVEFTIV